MYSVHGHKGRIHDLALSTDGSLLASSGADRQIFIWDVRRRRRIRRLRVPKEPANPELRVQFIPGTEQVVSWGYDHGICLWDAMSGKLLHRLLDASGRPACLAVSDNSQLIAAGCHDGLIRCWAAGDLGEVAMVEGHTAQVQGATWWARDRYLVTFGKDFAFRVWHGKSFKELRCYPYRVPIGRRLASIRNSPVVLSSGRDLRMWNMKTGLHEGKLCPPTDLDGRMVGFDFAVCGESIVVGEIRFDAGILKLIDARTREFVGSQHVGGEIVAIAASQSENGSEIATADKDGSIHLWSLSALRGASVLSFGPNLSGASQEPQLVADFRVAPFLQHASEIDSIAASPDGKLIATSGNDAGRIWRLADGKQISEIRDYHKTHWLSWSGRGDRLAFHGTLYDDPERFDETERWYAVVWDVASNSEIMRFPSANRNTTVMISPDGQTVLFRSTHNGVQLGEIATGTHRRISGQDNVTSYSFLSDSARCVLGYKDGLLCSYLLPAYAQIVPGRMRQTHECERVHVGGGFAASIDGRNSVCIWDLEKTRLHTRIPVDGDCYIIDAVMSGNGDRVAVVVWYSAQQPGVYEITVWNTSTSVGTVLAQSSQRSLDRPRKVAFSVDGSELLVAWDETVRVFGVIQHQERTAANVPSGALTCDSGTSGARTGFEELVDQLVTVGSSNGYLAIDGSKNSDAVKIGRQLNELGGFNMMLQAHNVVAERLGNRLARHLEACWGGVGDWQS